MPITSGSIEYERRLNLGEYNHKNVVAKVSWVVDLSEDEDVLAASAAEKVVTRVMQVLRYKPAVPAEEPTAQKPEPKQQVTHITLQNLETMAAPNLAAQHPVAEITAGIPPTLKRHRRTKAEMEAGITREEKAAQMEAARAAAEAGPRGVDLVGPTLLASSELISGGEPGMPTHLETAITRSNPPIEPGMPSFDPDPALPAEVTDLDLQNACQARVSNGLTHAVIKELVAKFSPGALAHTPQDARRRFLDELAKL